TMDSPPSSTRLAMRWRPARSSGMTSSNPSAERTARRPKGVGSEPRVGVSAPLGAAVIESGVNFSVYSKRATGIALLLFDGADDPTPTCVIRIDPTSSRTYHYWHLFVPGLKAGQLYAFRAYGPFNPSEGYRFDSGKVLLDPYGRGVVVPSRYNRAAACHPG